MHIGIIGTGNMGTILTEAIIDSQAAPQEHIHITNRTIEKALQIKANYPNIHVEETVEEVVSNSEMIFICVKPMDIYPLLIKTSHLLKKDKCTISITSPFSVEQLESIVQCSCMRVIPSITNRALSGVCLVTYGTNCSDHWKQKVNSFLSYIGNPIEIEQQYTRVASDIVSCGPAFFSFLTQKFIDAAVKETGINKDLATQLAQEMLVGMGTLIKKGHYSLPTLQEKVCVKGGVTGKGIEVLDNSQIEDTFRTVFNVTQRKFAEDQKMINNQFNFFGK
ncbi:late competence protein ComER [Pallidibacillus pasinlerensis]|uniref:Pyrroline-5-carboxylate reductase n=1 Tax=Pallidibacillus pasinlerensis TaxID=2703818 RepID=A0ABX0A3S8_9BACI|nr:late competence protein ComER [Pallidibacillus pasinlerensis]NCU17477.1 late competence protein ComER [Pallidibacillus pasinlerensis]